MPPSSAPSETRAASLRERHIPALDGIRGLAILLVLMDHLLWSNGDVTINPVLRVLSHVRAAGWVGVDLFFVLSGFLITGILYDTLDDPRFFRNFYARRTLRIFPLYYGFLLLLVAIGGITGARLHWDGLLRFFTYTLNLTFRPVPSIDAAWVNVNHFWTLAIEEQFYLLWPLLVSVLRTRRRIAAAAALGVLFSLSLRVFLYRTGFAEAHPYALTTWTPARLDALFSGALLATGLRSPRWRDTVLSAAPWLLLLCVAGLAVPFSRDNGLPWGYLHDRATWGLTVLAIIFTALLACGLRDGSAVQRVFQNRLLRLFGRLSYGLYVYHFTLRALIEPHVRQPLLERTGSHAIALFASGLLTGAVSFAAAWVSFRYFEQPILRLKRRFHASTPRHTELHAAP